MLKQPPTRMSYWEKSALIFLWLVIIGGTLLGVALVIMFEMEHHALISY